MIKLVFFFMVGMMVLQQSHAQKEGSEKASRYQSLSKKQKLEATGDLLAEAAALKNSDPAEALNRVEEVLAVSITQNNLLRQGQCYLLLGEINESIQEWKLALENYSMAYDKLLDQRSNTADLKKSLTGIGNMYLKLQQHDEALGYFNQYMELSLTSKERVDALLSISEVYYQRGDHTRALSTVEEAEKASARLDQITRAAVSNQKAKIYAVLDVDKATSLYQSSQSAIRSNQATATPEDYKALESAKENIINTLREQNRVDDEIQLRHEAIEYNLESKKLEEVTADKVELGKALALKGETTSAVRELEEAAFIADTIGNPKEKANAYLALANLYEKNDNPYRAIDAYRQYTEAMQAEEQQRQGKLTEKSDLIRKQRDIEELTKYLEIWRREETIREATVYRQQLTIYGLSAMVLIIGITSFFIYKNARASKVANQLLALKSLRSQMNPHFIFNALNSVNHFVAQHDERTANRFLSEFSMLMRLVLENSQEDFISLQKEYEIISLYLKLEHYRFRDKFDYTLNVDESINMETIEIPPMLIQPYIENAVWHGLRYKESKGKLNLTIEKKDDQLVIEIADDGIGRKNSIKLKTVNQKKHNSTGLKNIEERLDIINKVYHKKYQVAVHDLHPETHEGTVVVIQLPIKYTLS